METHTWTLPALSPEPKLMARICFKVTAWVRWEARKQSERSSSALSLLTIVAARKRGALSSALAVLDPLPAGLLQWSPCCGRAVTEWRNFKAAQCQVFTWTRANMPWNEWMKEMREWEWAWGLPSFAQQWTCWEIASNLQTFSFLPDLMTQLLIVFIV